MSHEDVAAHGLLYIALLVLGGARRGVTPGRWRPAAILVGAIVARGLPAPLFSGVVVLAVTEWVLLIAFHVLVCLALFEYLLDQPESTTT